MRCRKVGHLVKIEFLNQPTVSKRAIAPGAIHLADWDLCGQHLEGPGEH